MKPNRNWIAGVLLLALIGAAIVALVINRPPAEPGMEENFAWFDALGLPSSRDEKFVKVDPGLSIGGSADKEKYPEFGFLLNDDEVEIKIRDLEFIEQRFPKDVEGKYRAVTPTFEPADFTGNAGQLLEFELDQERGISPFRLSAMLPRMSNRAFAFVQAWRAAKRGNGDLAAKLYAKAQEFPAAKSLAEITDDFSESVRLEIEYFQMWSAVYAFTDPTAGRPELVRKFERFAASFPDSEHAGSARETVRRLNEMIAEDEAHEARTPEEIEELSADEQAAEWIFQLREQGGERWLQEEVRAVMFRGEPDGPARKLVKLGHAAVPRLIEALDDQRFTRGLSFREVMVFNHDVLPVGDCVATILGDISGEAFFDAHQTVAYLESDPAKHPKTKEAAERWWADFQELGEEELLVRGVKSAGDSAVHQAGMLGLRHPERLLEALAEGIPASKEEKQRERLVGWLGNVRGDGDPVPALKTEMAESPWLTCRLAAAGILFTKGQAEPAVVAMVAEWKNHREWTTQAADSSKVFWEFRPLSEFLLKCADIRATRAVCESFPRFNFELRHALLSVLMNVREPLWTESKEKLVFSAEVLAEIEQLLAANLEDLEPFVGMSGSRNDDHFGDPRLCDIAAEGLETWFPERYEFEIGASFKKREAQRVVLLNGWRERQGLEPVEPTRFFEPEPVAATTLVPLLDKLSERDARAEIERLGLGALPQLFDAERALPDGDPTKEAVRELVMRLANRVGRVSIGGEIVDDSAPWIRMTRELVGAEFEPKAYVEILRAFARDRDARWGGIRLEAVRHADLTGVDLILWISPPPAGAGDAWSGFSTKTRVAAGRQHGLGVGGGEEDRYKAADGFDEFLESAAKALAYPPTEEVTIREQLARKFK